MDIQALLMLAAMCNKQGRKELALSILDQVCGDAGFGDCFNSAVQPVANAVPNLAVPVTAQIATPACDSSIPTVGNEGGLDGLDSFVADKGEIMPVPQGDMPSSENTWNPSLHGDDSVALGQVIAVASAIYAQQKYLYEGETIEVDPHLMATASDALEPYDDHALVPTVARSENPASLKPGRLTIKI